MKKILLILCLIPFLGYSQVSYKIKADSTILNNIGSGTNELVIRNSTKSVTNGVLTNLGNGVTAFVAGSSSRNVDTIYKNSAKDSIVFTISGVRYAIRDSIGGGADIYATEGVYKDNDTIKLGDSTILDNIKLAGDSANLTIGNFDNFTLNNTGGTFTDAFLRSYSKTTLASLDSSDTRYGSFNVGFNKGNNKGWLMYGKSFGTGVTAYGGGFTGEGDGGLIFHGIASNQIAVSFQAQGTNSDGFEVSGSTSASDVTKSAVSLSGNNSGDGLDVKIVAQNGKLRIDGAPYVANADSVWVRKDGVEGLMATPQDSQSLYLAYTDSITLGITRGNEIKFAYAVDSVGAVSGGDSIVIYKAGVRTTIPISSGGVSISDITDATSNHTIDFGSYKTRITANSVAGDTVFGISSNSTLAASNLQTLLSINLTGANATSTQSTFGIKVSNKKTGTASSNHGLQIDVSGGSQENKAIEVVAGDIDLPAASKLYFNSSTQQQYISHNGSYYAYIGGSTQHWFQSSDKTPFYIANAVGSGIYGHAKPTSNENSLCFSCDYSGSNYRGEITTANIINASGGTLKIGANTGLGGSYANFTPNWVFTVKPTGALNLTPITATAASAITAAEGDIVFVSDTNGTFTSIGFWGYQNGAWTKM